MCPRLDTFCFEFWVLFRFQQPWQQRADEKNQSGTLSGWSDFLPCPILCLHWCKDGLVPLVISDLQVAWLSLEGIWREWRTVTVMGPCAFGSYTAPVNTELSNAHSLTPKFLHMQAGACSLRKHTALCSTCPAAWDLDWALRAADEVLVWLNSLAKFWSFPGVSSFW